MGRLTGRVALITGAGSGQGRAATSLFISEGAAVVGVDVNADGLEGTAATVVDGSRFVALLADVADLATPNRMVDAARTAFGRLDVLYNNAAVQMSGRLLECTDDDWSQTIDVNLSAVFRACRAALGLLGADGGGSIINTASVLGLVGSEGYAAYGPSKAGLVALTRQIALDYGPSVRANVIAPGSIDTPRFRGVADASGDPQGFVDAVARHIPAGRLGTADDVASIALFLASDESAYLTGAVVPADGGLAVLR